MGEASTGTPGPSLAAALDQSQTRPTSSNLPAVRRPKLVQSTRNSKPISRASVFPRSKLGNVTSSTIVGQDSKPAEGVKENVPLVTPSAAAAATGSSKDIASSTSEVAAALPTTTCSTGGRSTRPTRTAVGLASSASSQPVKASGKPGPHRTAAKQGGGKSVYPPKSSNSTAPTPAVKLTQAELESITKLNTARNEVIFSAINTIKQRRPGPRPRVDPLTIAEKEASLSRQERALRRQDRSIGTHALHTTGTNAGSPSSPLQTHRRGPGDVEQYTTPARPAKRSRDMSSPQSDSLGSPSHSGRPSAKRSRVEMLEAGGERRVRWDKGLVVNACPRLSQQSDVEDKPLVKGCLKKVSAVFRAERNCQSDSGFWHSMFRSRLIISATSPLRARVFRASVRYLWKFTSCGTMVKNLVMVNRAMWSSLQPSGMLM